MDSADRMQAARALARISGREWSDFFDTSSGWRLKSTLDIAKEIRRIAGLDVHRKEFKPVDSILDLWGYGLVGDREIRRLMLRSLAPSRWKQLKRVYRNLDAARADTLHGNATQHRDGSEVMADFWHQGSQWAHEFCKQTGLPSSFAERHTGVLPEDEEVVPTSTLPRLHDFQLEVYQRARAILKKRGVAAVLSLPTGAGKTRVAVESVLDHLAEQGLETRRNVVIWIAQSDELLRQAWECFREVWQSPDRRVPGKGLIHIRRAWGSRSIDGFSLGPEPTIVIAGVQQLARWVEQLGSLERLLPVARTACVIVDEAHRVIAQQHRDVLVALGIRAQHRWRTLRNAPPVLGLTATPWKTSIDQSASLRTFFQSKLLTPQRLKSRPIQALQKRRILAKVDWESLIVENPPEMTAAQRQRFETFHELPQDYLDTLGSHPGRNALIVRRLLRLAEKRSTLVFACSIEHAELLALCLNQSGRTAAVVTGDTPRFERLARLRAFNEKRIQFLCNVAVLTTGFDAPRVDAVCITRPTTSALLYEQMVGRGLRGPRNGGTERCLVLDVQDAGLPDSIMSYQRVLAEWS